MNNSFSNQNRIFGLDLMRALAILMVLSSHILWIYPSNSSLVAQVFQYFGFLGVELFFVLSGFLIGGILYQKYVNTDFTSQSVFHFLKRRWFRTLPNYYLFLVLNILIGLYIGYDMPNWWSYFFFLHNFATELMAFFTESWSLSVEEFSYLLLPIALLFVPIRNKTKAFLWTVFFLLFVFLFNKFYYNITTTNTDIFQWNTSLKSVVIYRVDAILMGVLFSWISFNFQSIWQKHRVNFAFLGMALLLFLFVGLGYLGITIEHFPTFWNVFYLPLTSFTVALFLPILSQWKTSELPFQNGIVFVSKISYSIYLIHYGIVLQLLKHFLPTQGFQSFELHLYAAAFLILTFLISYLNYRYFEKPMMDLRDKF